MTLSVSLPLLHISDIQQNLFYLINRKNSEVYQKAGVSGTGPG